MTNETQQTDINWVEEKENLGGNWWKPDVGQHTVVFLSNGRKNKKTFTDKQTGEAKDVEQVSFEISVGKEQYAWDVTVGVTTSSLFGQLVLVGAEWKGVRGKSITLLVKGVGQARQYTVLEALPLMQTKGAVGV